MPAGSKGRISIFEYQAPRVLNQGAPVQNTWYPIGAVMVDALIYCIAVNIEDTDETLEIRITADTEVLDNIANGVACVNSASYQVYFSPNAITRQDNIYFVNLAAIGYSILGLQGRSILVEVRKTTAAGVGNLTGVVVWGQKVDIP